METVNNGVFSTAKLKKNTPVLIMFFSPGCDHCIHQFEDMRKRMNELKKYQIVMATYQPIEELAEFNKKYQISKYPNIITGRDHNYALPPFFEISNFPYLAFYDKSGKLITTHEGNMSVDNMLKKFK
jgi:thioredoxin-related protein